MPGFCIGCERSHGSLKSSREQGERPPVRNTPYWIHVVIVEGWQWNAERDLAAEFTHSKLVLVSLRYLVEKSNTRNLWLIYSQMFTSSFIVSRCGR